jgi:hypothetical protein
MMTCSGRSTPNFRVRSRYSKSKTLSTMKSNMARSSTRIAMLSAYGAHRTAGDLASDYQRRDWAKEKREALSACGKRLSTIGEGRETADNVIPLRAWASKSMVGLPSDVKLGDKPIRRRLGFNPRRKRPKRIVPDLRIRKDTPAPPSRPIDVGNNGCREGVKLSHSRYDPRPGHASAILSNALSASISACRRVA